MPIDKIKRLLSHGYFPSQLPPPFQTIELAAKFRPVLEEWKAIRDVAPTCQIEVFSVARSGHARRILGLANPISHTYLCADISKNWSGLSRHYRKDKLGITHPKFDGRSDRGASVPSMHDLYERKILASAGHKFMLRTDISRFFPTIYTHTIPWALHTKLIAKKHRGFTPEFFGNILDRSVRQGQDQQTIGLPIGPDTSHIIAEAIATSIDVSVRTTLGYWPTGFRFVDDFYLFFETYAQAEEALSAISKALAQYQLQLNSEKTQIVAVEKIVEDFWTHQIRNCTISIRGRKQRSDIHHFFDFASDLAKRNADENVMKYALKRISSVVITKENWDAFEAHICRVALAFPNTLQTISGIFATYAHYGYAINKERLSRVLNLSIEDHAELGHHSEVAWSLWMCKELEVRIRPKAIAAVSEMRSSVCALLLLDWEKNSGMNRKVKKNFWRQFANKEALVEDMWLLAYEGGIKKWLASSDQYVSDHQFFKSLSSRNISFYNNAAKSKRIFSLKGDVAANLGLFSDEDLFDREDDLTAYLEFEDGDIGYDGVISDDEEDDVADAIELDDRRNPFELP